MLHHPQNVHPHDDDIVYGVGLAGAKFENIKPYYVRLKPVRLWGPKRGQNEQTTHTHMQTNTHTHIQTHRHS